MPSIKDIGELIKSLELKHKVGLAGSFARGTAKKSSDIYI